MTTLVARLLQAQINTFDDDCCSLTKQQEKSLSKIKDIYGSRNQRKAASKAQEERDKTVRRTLNNIRHQLGFAAFLICLLAISPSRLSKFRSTLDSDFRQWWKGVKKPQPFVLIAERLSQEPPWGTSPSISGSNAAEGEENSLTGAVYDLGLQDALRAIEQSQQGDIILTVPFSHSKPFITFQISDQTAMLLTTGKKTIL